MSDKLSIVVYCASSKKVNSIYLNEATKLGEIFSKENIHCIYGAGHVGLMGALADKIIEKKGEITGVIPRFMIEQGWGHKRISNVIITENMHLRKEKMAQMADAVVALPGGCGTLEELLEIITWKQLSIFTKPIIIVNINGYYDSLINMLNKAIEENFMRKEHANLWIEVDAAEKVLAAISNAPKNTETGYDFAVV